MEIRDVNHEVNELINKNLALLKSELLIAIDFKEEISRIYIDSIEKIREDLNKIRSSFSDSNKLGDNEKEYIYNSYFEFGNSALQLFNLTIERIK